MGRVYIVKPGDSLYSIAMTNGTTVDAIMKANNLKSTGLNIGQKLILPVSILPTGIYGSASKGEAVRAIQHALIGMGFALIADGVYAGNTAYIVKSIQQKYPELLTADGIYGPKTKAVIEKLLNAGYRIIQNPASPMVLVNKTNALPPSYIPANLVTPRVPAAAGYQLRSEAARALEELFAQAKLDNIPLYGVSGYRSYDRQASLFASNVLKNPNANLTSARPGESEHQTGLTTDVSSPTVDYALTEAFGDSDAGKWLRTNAPKFGFIIRYPKGSEPKTGYAYEPWHIRYVGKDAAQKIAAQRETLEDYLRS